MTSANDTTQRESNHPHALPIAKRDLLVQSILIAYAAIVRLPPVVLMLGIVA
jgi:hypothetical protein